MLVYDQQSADSLINVELDKSAEVGLDIFAVLHSCLTFARHRLLDYSLACIINQQLTSFLMAFRRAHTNGITL